MNHGFGCCIRGEVKTIMVKGICSFNEGELCAGHSVKILFRDNSCFEGPIDTLDLCSLVNAVSSGYLISAIDLTHIQKHGMINSPYFPQVPNVESVIRKIRESKLIRFL